MYFFKYKYLVLIAIFSYSSFIKAKDEQAVPIFEEALDYQIKLESLKKGNFQYFFSLLKQNHEDGNPNTQFFQNLIEENCQTKTNKILETFLPLDTKKLWNDHDKNYLAVAKMSYLLPIKIDQINEKKFNNISYLQKTMPNYEVIKKKDHYFVDGSFLTPAFNLYLKFLSATHPYTRLIKEVDMEKIKSGKMKVSFQHQDKFGRVMMVRTAKMASAMTIYQDYGIDQTLVTQYILSNVINVPTNEMIKKGMVENMQNVVKGSRLAVRDF